MLTCGEESRRTISPKKMKYERFIGLRYLKSRRKQSFISIISVISVGGVAVGVATVILAISVMNGFEAAIKDKFLANEAHLSLSPIGGGAFSRYDELIEEIEKIEKVRAASPVILAQAGIQRKSGDISGVIIKGIDPEREDRVTGIKKFVSEPLDFEPPLLEQVRKELKGKETVAGGIIIGKDKARSIGVERGDIVRIISKLVDDPVRSGGLMPMVRNFVVLDIYTSGMYVYDNAFAFLSLSEAQKLYSYGDGVNSIEIRADNPDVIGKVREEMLLEIDFMEDCGFFPRTRTWMETHAQLFDAMKLEKLVTFIIEGLIILVAAFNIASTLIMMVMDKTKDIGILKAMGASKKSIRKIFTLEGGLIGIFGAAIGTALGLLLCWSLETWFPIYLNSEIYQISRLPAKINWLFVLGVNVGAILICYIAALYPAHRASTLDPVEAIHYE